MKKIPICPPVTGKLTAVLYSVSQDCFHLETVAEYLKNNIQDGLMKHTNCYRLIGITNSDIEGDCLIEEYKKAQKKLSDYTRDRLIDDCFTDDTNQ